MDKIVHVLRSKRTGNYILNPSGTFRGYGGYVGINPYVEVPADAAPEQLARSVLELIELSGPTGVDIKQAQRLREETADEETRRIREEYGLNRKGMTTSKLARQFLSADVEQRHGQKSWLVQFFSYDPRWRSLSGAEHKPVRVRHT